MEPQKPNKENNIIELNEENEEKNDNNSPTLTRHLREIKKVNYSKFFSEDQDNSEDYEPEEKNQKIESIKKRPRQKSVTKVNPNPSNKKKKENENPENKMEVEVENEHKKNKNSNGFGHIIDIAATILNYSNNNENAINNVNDINIPNSDLILIILEICLNSSQFGIDKDNSSRAFWEEVGQINQLKPITSKFKTETLRKYWRTIRETKKFRKIITETKRYKNELNNNNLKLLSSIKVICDYVSSPSKRKIEYYLNKHIIIKPSNKPKRMNVSDMTTNEQISEIINTFIVCFPKRKEKEIIEALLQTSFDIQNAFLVLKDKENLGFFSISEKDDEIVKRNYEEKDDNNEEYQELVNIKGLEDVIRRKEFLFNVKIDRSQYNKLKEGDENLKVIEVIKKENKEDNKDNNKKENNDKDNKECEKIENKEE